MLEYHREGKINEVLSLILKFSLIHAVGGDLNVKLRVGVKFFASHGIVGILRLLVESGPREVRRPSFAVETTLLSRETQIVSIGNFSGCMLRLITLQSEKLPMDTICVPA